MSVPEEREGLAPLVLVVEDEISMLRLLKAALGSQGFRVVEASSGQEALRQAATRSPDVVVLDLGLPDLDGSEVVRHLLRLQLDTPVLVLSARDGLDERIRLLDIGADDYLVKPAAMDEFLARVRAVLRRRRAGGERLLLGRLSIDLDGKRAYVDGEPLDLNAREWALLSFLAERANRVVAKEDIVAALFDAGEQVSDNAIEQIVSRFRRRIADAGVRLRTVRGLGYYLETGDA
jgi:two-component system OmpR family response regulator